MTNDVITPRKARYGKSKPYNYSKPECAGRMIIFAETSRKNLLLISLAILSLVVAAASTPTNITFTEIAAKSGIHFHYNNGATGKRYLPETMGAGCAFLDLDGDGWQDILLVNGKDFGPHTTRSLPALYRNNKDTTFTDITKGSGLDIELYGMGVAAADYDNDGLPDIYITALEGDHLFHNEGHGHFRDVTVASGIRNADFGTSAAWLDYDRDGKADIFIANYTGWSAKRDTWCSLDGTSKSYCTPESYSGTSSKLYRNLGNGKFQDVTDKAGLGDKTSKSLGVATLDYNGDGWTDLFVSNDTQPNKLYKNNGNGTFTEEGMQAGVAYAEDGSARGAMGVDASDYDNSGHPHLLVGNFANQMLGLYHNDGKGIFADQAPSSNIGRDTRLSLTFGAFFFDFDLDGLPDIFAVNGHIEPDIAKVQSKMQFRQAPQLFRNIGGGKFENASHSLGKDFLQPILGRGGAYADFDHDGDLDVLVSTNDGSPVLYQNQGGNKNNWLAVRLIGTKSNRSALGAVVRIQSALGKQWQSVHSGSSYCSQSDLTLTFGLRKDPVISTMTVEWPSGQTQQFKNLQPNKLLTVNETKGFL